MRWKIGGCNDALELLPDPHPSASQTPSPEGKAIRCGGDRADRVVRPYKKGVVGALQMTPKGDAQSAEIFRVVGMDGTDG